MLENGQPAPNFKLTADTNEEIQLRDFAGQRVLLFFYPKAGTSGCTTQACGFRDNYEVFTEHNALVLGISPDTPDKLAKWKAKENFPYLLLSDPDHVVAEAYGVWGEKSLYGRKYMGIIRSHFVVDADGNLEDVQVKISPKKSISVGLKQIQA